jgi:tellurite methyltransferase
MSTETNTTTKETLEPSDFLPYYQMIANVGPSKLLLEALALVENDTDLVTPAFAVDLGCGTGKDTAELLRLNWTVLAIDFSADGIASLLARPEATTFKNSLETRVASFADTAWSDATMVVSLLALPYCPPAQFDSVWEAMSSSLKTGGYFVGQLFGRGQYADASYITHLTRAQVDELLLGFTVIKLEEVDREVTHEGETMRYHYFDIIAKRK